MLDKKNNSVFSVPQNVRSWILTEHQQRESLLIKKSLLDSEGTNEFPVISHETFLPRTSMVLATILHMKDVKSVLFITHSDLKENWKEEACIWFNTSDHEYNKSDGRWVEPSPYTVSGWTIKSELFSIINPEHEVHRKAPIMFVDNSFLEEMDIPNGLSDSRFDLIVLDDASFIKDPLSKLCKSIYSLKSKYRIALN